MNGDSYSSRGMASATTLPRIRKHETDTNNPSTADAGRYGSSRDHYVSSYTCLLKAVKIKLTYFQRLREMDAEMNVARAEIGKDIAVAAVIDDVLDLQATVMQGRHVESRT